MLLVLLLLLPGVRVEEASPSSLLSPRHFNEHSFNAVQFLKKSSKGPIQFPNDSPPPAPTPLIVTSRPLIESIRRSELNPNNTIEAQSQINPVTFTPKILARFKEYKPYVYDGIKAPRYQFDNPYALIVKKKQGKPDYNDYEGENYAFSYKVKDHKTGDDFSHSQSSSGSATNGEYRVRLPDGRMQIVSYTADENGYKADVRYDDHEEHTNGNHLESDTNKNDVYQNNFYDDHYKTSNAKPILTIQNNHRYIDYEDKGNTGRIHEYNDHYSDYLLSDNDNTYLGHYNKSLPTYNDNTYKERNQDNDYYHYTDDSGSKELMDYSNEFDYQPHKSKYSSFAESNTAKSNFKPSYEELKGIFLKKLFENPRYKSLSSTLNPNFDTNPQITPLVSSTISPNFYTNRINAQSVLSTISPTFDLSLINAPIVSSTIRPDFYGSPLHIPSTLTPNFGSTTENIVLIGMKKPELFTNIRNIITANAVTPSSPTYSSSLSPVGPTPSTYLISTITNLRNKISLSKTPELSNNFIDKINKYLSYK